MFVGPRLYDGVTHVPLLPRLRRVREEAGLSQEKLSERSGVARSNITRAELLQTRPRISTVVKLARALGVRPGDLYGPEKTPDC